MQLVARITAEVERIRVGTDDEAVDLANDSKYGLVVGAWTADISRAITVSERIQPWTA